MKDLSIVILTWKSREMLRRCLASIYKETLQTNFEIVLIDNASHDGTVEMVKQDFPEVILICNSENRGVAPARNQGLKVAKGELILILDVDTEVKDRAIDKLAAFMKRNPTIGISGAKLYFADGTVQDNCKRYLTVLTPILRRLDFIPFVKNLHEYRYQTMADWDHSSTIEVDYLIGACQMIQKKVIDMIGYLDDNIFYGPEDVDFCLRARLAGWKIVFYHQAEIIHYHQRITRKIFSKITLKHILGLAYFFKKHRYLFTPPIQRQEKILHFRDSASDVLVSKN
jgi:N-acetylglucosaminyl-diphospho-decaprenol L-rhamnosyltransferase